VTLKDRLRHSLPIETSGEFDDLFRDKCRQTLERDILPSYIVTCRWFAGKAGKIQDVEIIDDIPFNTPRLNCRIALIRVTYLDRPPEVYLLPVTYAVKDEAKRISNEFPQAVICDIKTGRARGLLYDALYDEEFRRAILSFIAMKKTVRGYGGSMTAFFERRFQRGSVGLDTVRTSSVMKVEQSNTSIEYEKKFILKLYRKLEEGVNPDIEMTRAFSERPRHLTPNASAAFSQTPDVAAFSLTPHFRGHIEYQLDGSAEPISIGHLQDYVDNQGDAWSFTRDSITRYYERALSEKTSTDEQPSMSAGVMEAASEGIPAPVADYIGTGFLETVKLLGRTTARFHRALAMRTDDPAFAPEPFTSLDQRSLYQSMQSLAKRVFHQLAGNLKKLPEHVGVRAARVAALDKETIAVFRGIMDLKVSAVKIRIHGDYHLGQALWTGGDFVIIDLEGEPARSLSERRLKRSALCDVAGMLRSFHYAAYGEIAAGSSFTPKEARQLIPWADLWYRASGGAFLGAYLGDCREAAGGADFIPRDQKTLESLIRIFLLEKAVYELGYELNNRPDWVGIPITGIMEILGGK
jgi:maltose alpha-D-glucosyltransferase/alpha-amylase